jgi:hypothetical protein
VAVWRCVHCHMYEPPAVPLRVSHPRASKPGRIRHMGRVGDRMTRSSACLGGVSPIRVSHPRACQPGRPRVPYPDGRPADGRLEGGPKRDVGLNCRLEEGPQARRGLGEGSKRDCSLGSNCRLEEGPQLAVGSKARRMGGSKRDHSLEGPQLARQLTRRSTAVGSTWGCRLEEGLQAAHTCGCAHTVTRTRARARAHAHTFTRTHTLTRTHTRTHTHRQGRQSGTWR